MSTSSFRRSLGVFLLLLAALLAPQAVQAQCAGFYAGVDSLRVVYCKGDSTGRVKLAAIGGASPFQYARGTGSYSSTDTFANLPAGTYTFHIKDANNCIADTIVTVAEPLYAFGGYVDGQSPVCNGLLGTAVYYAYDGWSSGNYLTSLDGSPFDTATVYRNVSIGLHSYAIKDSLGCVDSDAFSIRSFTPPFHISIYDPSCTDQYGGLFIYFGMDGSSLALDPEPDSIQVEVGTQIKKISGSTIYVDFDSLASGNHILIATRYYPTFSCSDTSYFSIDTPVQTLFTTTVQSPTCFGGTDGSITVQVTSGVAPFQYAIDSSFADSIFVFTGLAAGSHIVYVQNAYECFVQDTIVIASPDSLSATLSLTPIACNGGGATGKAVIIPAGGTPPYSYKLGTAAYTTLDTFSNLAAGSYTVTLRDSNSCTKSFSFTITAPATALSLSTVVTAGSCSGAASGSITVTGTGGTTPYTYALGTGIYAPTNTFTGLSAGIYTVRIKDTNGCTAQRTDTVSQPGGPTLSFTQTNVVCNGGVTGSITASGTGGATPYNYALNAGTYSATNTFTGLAAGTYTLRIKDGNNCTAQVSVTITQSAGIVLTPSQVNVLCNGGTTGSISASAISGGSSPYTFALDAGAYTGSSSFPGLSAGSYTLRVKDANNCTAQVTVTLTQPPVLSVTTTQVNGGCSGGTGSITATGVGGTSPYTFAIGAGTYSVTNTFTGLAAGTYTVRTKDASNCMAQTTVVITQSAGVAVATTQTNVLCNGDTTGSITVTGSGGTSPYTYALDAGTYSATNTFGNLTAGSYTVRVKDAGACIGQTTVVITQPALLVLASTQTNVGCNGGTTGSITASGTGGVSPYTYALAAGTYSATNVFTGLTAGSYQLRIKDANGCVKQSTLTITQPTVVSLSTTSVNVLCNGAATGSITATGIGGTSPYTFAIGAGTYGSLNTFAGLTAGTYTVRVKDAANCTAQVIVTLTEPAALSLTTTQINGGCSGGTGSITATGVGGNSLYTYAIGAGTYSATNTFTGLTAGTYTVRVKDGNNCTAQTTVVITQSAAPTLATTQVNVLCNGASTGSITATGAGGTTPYTFAIGAGTYSTANTFTGLSAGSYTVRIKDGNNCTSQVSVTITEPTLLALTTTQTSGGCSGATGSITATGVGGTSPYTFAIGAGTYSATNTFTGLAAGTYIIRVKDNNSCTAQVSVTISSSSLLTIATTQTNVLCNGASTGSITASGTGGATPYTFAIGAGTYSTTNTFTGLAAGSYTVFIKDGNNCTSQATVTITEPPVLTLTTTQINGGCSGGSTGSITATGVGGNSLYTFAIGAGTYSATNTFTGLTAGTYTVRVKDGNNCTAQTTVVITQSAAPTLATTQTNVLCNGAATGSITASGTGGATPYTFAIGAGTYSATNTFTGLAAGTYTVRIKDAASCTTQVSVTITEPTLLSLTTTQTSGGCSGATGSITATGVGGTSPYTYAIGAGMYSTSNTFTGLSAGSYTVRIKDANNCTSQVTVTITSSSLLAIATTQTNVLCNGASTGSITATGSGGSLPYTYAIGVGTYSTTNTFTGLAAGSYTVRIKDVNNCTSQATVTLTQPAVLSLATTQTNVLCNGGITGTATATGTGGTSPYTYAIGAGTYSATNTFTGLAAGTYTVRVKDAANCTAQVTVVITQPAVLSVASTQTNVLCNGASTGSITASGIGGSSLYTFALDAGTYSTANTFTGLSAGSYTLRIKDGNNCTSQATVTITEPTLLALTTTQTSGGCSGATGSITATGVGGTSPYTFAIGAGTYSATNTFTGLAAGTYIVRVKDNNSCTAQVSVTISSSSLLTIATAQTNVLCNGASTGSITASGTGGATPYTFAIGTGTYSTTNTFTGLAAGNYTVFIKDGNNCTSQATVTITEPPVLTLTTTQINGGCSGGSTGSITATGVGGNSLYTYAIGAGTYSTLNTFTGLAAGSYTVRVKDGNNCTAQTTVVITQSALPTLATTQTNVLCNGASTGSITATGAGGTTPYTYAIGAGTYSATNIFTGLAAGTYIVRIKDNNSCTAQVSVTITEPTLLALTTTQTSGGCSGATGSITATGVGGTSPYTFAIGAGTYSATNTFTGLAAGTYIVRVKDNNSCTAQVSVTISGSSLLAVATTQTNVLCNGASTGSITASGTGGATPYTFAIGTGTYSTTNTFTGLAAGNYTVFIKDGNNCTSQATVTITEPPVLTLTTTQINGGCSGGSTGSITATGVGGNSLYTFAIGAGTYSTLNTFTGLAAGSYTVRVKDGNNCTAQTTVVITQPAAPTLATTQVNVLCNGAATGSITATGAGGTSPYTYAIGAGTYSATNTFTGLAAGTYTVRIKDNNSCTAQLSVTLTQPTLLALTTIQTNSGCTGASGSITATGTGGVSPYTYALDAGTYTSGNVFTALTAGSYTVRIKDANNCTSQVTVTITGSSLLAVATTQNNVLCNGGTTGSVTATGSGGTTPYTFAIGTGTYSTLNVFNGLAAGSYTVLIKDAANCTAQTTVTVTQPAALTVAATQINVACNGSTTGSIKATGTGGTLPYTFALGTGTYATADSFSNLSAGSYLVRIKDANSCVSQITVVITQPAVLGITTTQTNVDCSGNATGTITVAGTGGAGSYKFAIGSGTYQVGNTFTGLVAGTYTLRVQDGNSCIAQATVVITQPAPLALTTTQADLVCNGANNGIIFLFPTGGTAPYSSALNNGLFNSGTSFSNLPAGNYTVYVRDAKGCMVSVAVTLTQPPLLTLTGTATAVTCNGNANGSITVVAGGGVAPYTYSLSGGNFGGSSTFSGLPAGTYTLQVKDSKGCTAQTSVVVTQPAQFTATLEVVQPACFNEAQGRITITPAGGNAPYTYLWNTGATTATISNLTAGTYRVTTTDAKGCSRTDSAVLISPTQYRINLGPDRTLCRSQVLRLNADINVAGTQYRWTSTTGFTSTGSAVSIRTQGEYRVQATTPAGCKIADTIKIEVSTDSVVADFVAATQAFKDSLYTMVNISSPAPDKVEWILPPASKCKVISTARGFAEVVFRDTGTYDIGMRTFVGDCFEVATKRIVVVEGIEAPPIAAQTPFIKRFDIAPNPSSGVFEVQLELQQPADALLQVIDINTGNVVDRKLLVDVEKQAISYKLQISPGAYILLLQTANVSRSLKLLIQ